MHSAESKNGTVFHFNSDFSGDIEILPLGVDVGFHIPAEDLLELVAYHYVLPCEIEALEGAPWKDILKHRRRREDG